MANRPKLRSKYYYSSRGEEAQSKKKERLLSPSITTNKEETIFSFPLCSLYTLFFNREEGKKSFAFERAKNGGKVSWVKQESKKTGNSITFL